MYRRRYFTDGQVTTPQITENAVTEDKIANDAVTSPKIKNATIQTEDIADKAVTLAKLADDVPAVGIEDNSITASKLADNCVEKRHIKTASVDTDELANASVTTDKLRNNAVTKAKMADNSVGYSEIASQSLEPKAIKTISGAPATEGQIPVADLSQGNQWWFRWADAATRPLTPALTSAEIGAGAVDSSKLAVDSVTEEKLQANAVTSAKIALNAVVTEKLQDGCVTKAKAEIGFGRYVPLAKSTFDINVMDKDGAAPDLDVINVDWLELASLVPAGAIAVHLLMEIQTDTLAGTGMPNPCYIESNQTTKKYNRLKGSTIFDEQPSEQVYDYQGILMIDADRKLDVFASSDTTIFRVTVLGYII